MIPKNTNIKNAIEVRNLNFFYGKFQALKNINLNITNNKNYSYLDGRVLSNMGGWQSNDLYPEQNIAVFRQLVSSLHPEEILNYIKSKSGNDFSKTRRHFQCQFMIILLLELDFMKI